MANEKKIDRLTEEMKVTFDSEELASFFDSFEPLEFGEDGFPCGDFVRGLSEGATKRSARALHRQPWATRDPRLTAHPAFILCARARPGPWQKTPSGLSSSPRLPEPPPVRSGV